MPEDVYLSTRRGATDRKLHTDEACEFLQRASDYRPVERDEFPHLDICKACRGDIDRSNCSRSHHNALLEAATEGSA